MSLLRYTPRPYPHRFRSSGRASLWAVVTLTGLLLVGLWAFIRIQPMASTAAAPSMSAIPATDQPAKSSAESKPSASGMQTTPRVFFATPRVVEGQPLPRQAAVRLVTNEPTTGRIATLDRGTFVSLPSLQENDPVEIPLLDGKVARGTVHVAQHDEGGRWRIGGSLESPQQGSFAFGTDGATIGGLIQFRSANLAFEIVEEAGRGLLLRERRLSDLVCLPLPRPDRDSTRAPRRTRAPQEAPPILSSRPSAAAVLYLDFDGATVTDPLWNNGRQIVAAPSDMTNPEIQEIWARVKEDFWPFDVDVTTNPDRYSAARIGRRMRCIITPTETAAPGAGGVAYVDSFSEAGGNGYSSTIPSWVFNPDVESIAEAISHELGHTLGLRHDGRVSPPEEYYRGHGTGATSWAPIMGVGYDRKVVQWSKGEYLNASNKQDDLQLISRSANGFGYIADEAGDTLATTANLGVSTTAVAQEGVISRSNDIDLYLFVTRSGPVSLQAVPSAHSANLDIFLELLDESGVPLATSNPTDALDAQITTTVPGGVFYVRVRGIGKGNVLGTGYSAYGSLGEYAITGTIPGGVPEPAFTSGGTAEGEVGVPFSYTLKAVNSPTSYAVEGTLPPGLSFDPASATISGTPTQPGEFALTMRATNAFGSGTRDVVITVVPPQPPTITSPSTARGTMALTFRYQIIASRNPTGYGLSSVPPGLSFNPETGVITGTPTLAGEYAVTMSATNTIGTTEAPLVITIAGGTAPLDQALDTPGRAFTSSGTVPWLGQSANTFDGADAAQSGAIGHGASSVMSTTVQGPATLSFRYRIDSEQGGDFFKFVLDGIEQFRASGAVDWTLHTTVITAGSHTLRWEYSKNASASIGTDAAWVDSLVVATSPPPTVTSSSFAPARINVPFNYQIVATNAPTGYGVAGTLPAGLSFLTGTGRISGTPTEGGVFSITVSATNAAGTGTREVQINVEAGPLDLTGALDQETFVWSNAGSATWSAQTATAHDAVDAAAALGVGHGQSALLETEITGPASLRFFWKVSSEKDYDYLSFSLDGEEQVRISGQVDWQLKSLVIPEGTHRITFTYRKDASGSAGSDAAWVDEVSLFPREGLPGSDSFAGAQAIAGAFIDLHTSNLDATVEVGEKPPGVASFEHSLWWAWTAPESGTVIASTDGSNFDTALAVYTGDSLTNLQLVAANDNLSKKSTASQVRFTAEAGRTYFITIAGVGPAAGLVDFSLHYLGKGTHLGIVEADDTANFRAGYLQVTLTDALTYTAQLMFGGQRFSWRDSLATGSDEQRLTRKGGQAPLDVTLKMDLTQGSTAVTGTLLAGTTPYHFTARRRIAAADLLDGTVGAYTLLLEPENLGNGAQTFGAGYGRATITSRGDIRFSGFLADGQKASQGSALTFGRIWPMYFAPYKGAAGTLAGDIGFDPVATNHFQGDAHWRLENGATTFSEAVEVTGSFFSKPGRETTVLAVGPGSPNLQLSFAHQNPTSDPADPQLTLRAPNLITGAPTGLQLKLDVRSGLFSGSLPDPVTGKKQAFGGALLQSENRGAGFFNSTAGRGRVDLTPLP